MRNKNLIFTPVTMHGVQIGMGKVGKGKLGESQHGGALKFVPGLPKGLSSAGHSLRGRSRFTPAMQIKGTSVNSPKRMFTPVWAKNNTDPTLQYVPSVEGMYERGEHKEYTLDWWTKTAMFRYNALMVSAAYGMSEWNFREFYDIPRKDFLFITDSGGFQIFSQKLKFDENDILRWMEHNADVALALDRPPLKSYVPGVGDTTKFKDSRAEPADFKESIEVSKQKYETMAESRESKKLILLKPIHGFSIPELQQFYNAVKEIEGFDGHAFGANQNNIESVAQVLGFAQTIEKERVHMFLITGTFTAPAVIYAKRFFKHLTFDSSSFSVTGARYRKYYYPYRVSAGISFGKSYKSTLNELPCQCPICQLATVDDLNKDGSVPGGLIALHNLWCVLSYFDSLTKLADSPDDYIDFLRGLGHPETVRAVEYLRCIEENDFATANRKFNFDLRDLGEFWK